MFSALLGSSKIFFIRIVIQFLSHFVPFQIFLGLAHYLLEEILLMNFPMFPLNGLNSKSSSLELKELRVLKSEESGKEVPILFILRLEKMYQIFNEQLIDLKIVQESPDKNPEFVFIPGSAHGLLFLFVKPRVTKDLLFLDRREILKSFFRSNFFQFILLY